MILLVVLAAALLISLLFGGSLQALGQVDLKYGIFVLLAIGVQLLVFSSWWQAMVERALWAELLYLLSLLLLFVAVWFNRRVPGFAPLGLGLLLNTLVIAANGGRMPVSLQALRVAGIAASRAEFETLRVTNSILVGDETTLGFLGDIFAVPDIVPLSNVFSIG
ncbi:MAG: DUF5317 family protein, partial [Chloroflexota bacterium]|nr:DUF5317 family protein [Chloroflexota bacterium]